MSKSVCPVCEARGRQSCKHLDKTWDLYRSPEGRKIATVRAPNALQAIARTPKPYNKYRGEVYAVEVQS